MAQLGRAPGLGLGGRRFESCLPDLYYRGVEQLVARRAHNPEVVGSNPSPAIIIYYDGPVVERFNTPPCHGGDRRFKSGRDRFNAGVV